MATGARPAAAAGAADAAAGAGGAAQSTFGCDAKDLKELMQLRGQEAQAEIGAKYDGVTGLCGRLKTHPSQGRKTVN